MYKRQINYWRRRLNVRECESDDNLGCTEATFSSVDEILVVFDLGSFYLTFDNDTVEVRGGHGRSYDDVVISWTAPRPLDWIRVLAVGVQFGADTAEHIFTVHRSVGWCFGLFACGPYYLFHLYHCFPGLYLSDFYWGLGDDDDDDALHDDDDGGIFDWRLATSDYSGHGGCQIGRPTVE